MLGSQILAGSIPACAGEPARWPRFARSRGVYPRVCGERRLCQVLPCRSYGSSPRVRGTVRLAASSPVHDQFIPARAGNGRRSCPASCPTPVHPRACGERNAAIWPRKASSGSSPRVRGTGPGARPLKSGCHGSSPRVRGTVHPPRRQSPPRRFIPARAGNGANLAWGRTGRSVHPRACGERMMLR